MEGRYYSVEKIMQKVHFKNEEIVKKVQDEGRPIVFITSHYGAWELGGSLLSALIEPVMIVYKNMNNPYFQDYLLSSRKKFRMKYVERKGATRGILKQLKSGGAIALLIDTNVNKKEAITVDFLGKPVSQIKTTAYFARKFNAAIIPLLIHTKDDENYTITFYDEIIPPKTDDEKQDIATSVKMQTDWLSKEILKEPAPWFWLHRRFKDNYPEIYKK
jgi:KDO2-lipid IV(A) lauroyltransferase